MHAGTARRRSRPPGVVGGPGPSEGEPASAGLDGGGEVGASRGEELGAGGERAGLVGAAHEVVDRRLELLLAPRAALRRSGRIGRARGRGRGGLAAVGLPRRGPVGGADADAAAAGLRPVGGGGGRGGEDAVAARSGSVRQG